MKRTHIILTRCDDHDMLTVNGPPFMCIAADRFVVVDKRPAGKPQAAESPREGK